jgi:hypothetical protein
MSAGRTRSREDVYATPSEYIRDPIRQDMQDRGVALKVWASPLSYIADTPGRQLLLQLPFSVKERRSTPYRQRPNVAEAELETYIKQGLAAGCLPESRGKPFRLEITNDAQRHTQRTSTAAAGWLSQAVVWSRSAGCARSSHANLDRNCRHSANHLFDMSRGRGRVDLWSSARNPSPRTLSSAGAWRWSRALPPTPRFEQRHAGRYVLECLHLRHVAPIGESPKRSLSLVMGGLYRGIERCQRSCDCVHPVRSVESHWISMIF